MGYSKYTEDIEKIHSLNIFGTFLDFQVKLIIPIHHCPFCSFETQIKDQFEAHLFDKHRDAAIYLEYDDHIIPERAAFTVRPVHLKVRCLALPGGIEVAVQSNSNRRINRRTSRHYKDGQLLTITPPDEEIVTISLGLGPYRKEYGITFKKQIFAARLTKFLIDQVELANSRIATWEWAEAHQFKTDIVQEPGLSEEEQRHRLAIFEYFFGLWLEGNAKSEYKRHLERSFEVLRDFDEPLAHLISNYFLYRANAFETISPKLPFPRLRCVVAFFQGANMKPPLNMDSENLELLPCEIAIADADEAIFAAVVAYGTEDFPKALQLVEIAERRRTQSDDQAAHRLTFLRYRIAHGLGKMSEARSLAERLTRCGVQPFRREAELLLRQR